MHGHIVLNLLLCSVVMTDSSCVYNSGVVSYAGTFPGSMLSRASLVDCPKNATEINLGSSGITAVDYDTFADFYSLQRIRLDNNSISDLPDGLLFFKWELRYFDVSNNELTELRNDLFRDNPDLQTFLANNNNISTIESRVFHKDLREVLLVNMSYNSLTAFEPWPYLITSDQTDGEDLVFDLQHNLISELKNTYNWTYDLQQPYEYVVFLQHNEISNLSLNLLYMYNPNFSGNALTELLSYGMNLSVNPYYCNCYMYPYVRDLHKSFFLYYRVDEYRYRCDGPSHFKDIDALHDIELDQFVCHVTDKCPKGCTCIERPHIKQLVVNCSGAGLSSLPDTLPNPMDHDGHITLIMDYNRIQHFTRKNYTSKLLNVSMTYNSLEYIASDAVSAMKNATAFNVSNNRLQYVPKQIQFLEFDHIRLNNNPLQCDCNMTWMPDWIKLSPSAPDYNVQCTHKDDDKYLIREITDLLLVCNPEIIAIAVSIGLAALLSIIIGVVITAKRCPYETKVLIYKFFGIHPSDKYKVDGEENRNYDVYISCDCEDIQARQWIKTVFLPKVEEGKKQKYKVFTPLKDAVVGSDFADDLISSMRKSRRIVFLLTEGFFKNEWNIFETDQAELEHHSSDNLHGRVVYILWNKRIRELLNDDPWRARMEGKRVLCPDDRFFWSKMRYELPLKPLASPPKNTVNFTVPKNIREDNDVTVRNCEHSIDMISEVSFT